MEQEQNSATLAKATAEVLEASECLRGLASRVQEYPEAAKRLAEVSGALERVARGLESTADVLARHENSITHIEQRLNKGIDRIDTMSDSVLSAIETLRVAVEYQKHHVEKAAAKRGIIF